MSGAEARPVEITRPAEGELRIRWSDGHITRFSLQFFREACPCAGCKGETGLLGVHYAPLALPIVTPGKYELKALSPIGNYAVAAVWGDGHDTGIYSWKYLREMDERGRKDVNREL
jgi:DUF971 family protein